MTGNRKFGELPASIPFKSSLSTGLMDTEIQE
jgi:hypothetical protein